VGIHEPGLDPKKVKNTVIWIDEEGKIAQRYQKIHLFDVDIKDGPVLKESNSVEKGMEIQPPFETAVGKVASTICFDVSFTDTLIGCGYLLITTIKYSFGFPKLASPSDAREQISSPSHQPLQSRRERLTGRFSFVPEPSKHSLM